MKSETMDSEDEVSENKTPISRVPRSKEEAKATYDKISRWYDVLAGPFEKKFRDVALQDIGAKEGEIVLDLGAGAGFDCFLAANKVGKKGKVIGVDMTPEMLEKARENVEKGGYDNVEFRLGEIENLPVADNSVDAIISNCVINLALDKRKVFEDAFRVLKPEGRLMISDIVLLKELPTEIMNSVEAYVGCVSGAVLKDEYIKAIEQAGFQDVRIEDETSFLADSVMSDPTAKEFIEKFNISLDKVEDVMSSIKSIKVFGIKPKQ